MDLFILGAGMGLVGGMLPNPLQMIALTQVAAGRWGRAMFVLLVPPLIIDAWFLAAILWFFRYIPFATIRFVAYAGGIFLIFFASRSLLELRKKTAEELATSAQYTFAGIAVAALAEVAAPGAWIYWVTIAGPILAEGRMRGYGHVVSFFAGGLTGYYGAAIFSTCLIAWGASLHKSFKRHLVLAANLLLLLFGVSYLVRAYRG